MHQPSHQMRHPPTNPRLIAVAQGDAPADLVLADARVVNVFTRQIERGDIAIAAVLALMLGWTLKLTQGARKTALLLGFAGMMSAEVLVMQQFPDIFAQVYTPAYVTATVSQPVAFF